MSLDLTSSDITTPSPPRVPHLPPIVVPVVPPISEEDYSDVGGRTYRTEGKEGEKGKNEDIYINSFNEDGNVPNDILEEQRILIRIICKEQHERKEKQDKKKLEKALMDSERKRKKREMKRKEEEEQLRISRVLKKNIQLYKKRKAFKERISRLCAPTESSRVKTTNRRESKNPYEKRHRKCFFHSRNRKVHEKSSKSSKRRTVSVIKSPLSARIPRKSRDQIRSARKTVIQKKKKENNFRVRRRSTRTPLSRKKDSHLNERTLLNLSPLRFTSTKKEQEEIERITSIILSGDREKYISDLKSKQFALRMKMEDIQDEETRKLFDMKISEIFKELKVLNLKDDEKGIPMIRKVKRDGNRKKKKKRRRRSEKKSVEEVDIMECKICMERRIDHAFQCGHTFCRECAYLMTECPFCKENVVAVLKLFV